MQPRILPVTRRNHWFQLAEALKTSRQRRQREKMFFVEGVRSLNQLRNSDAWDVVALLYAPQKRLSGWARDVLRDLPNAQRLELAPALMEALADRQEGSELLALVRIPAVDAAAVMPRGEGCVVVLDRPGNPGNLGSILRSCDAFDALGIVMTGHAVDPFDPVVIRASAGAFFSRRIVPIADHESFAAWLAACRAACPGLAVLGTSEKAALLLPRADLTGPRVLAFGNEATGLSPWLTSLCGGMVGMPMRGVASSLNLACAVTAVLYERDRQRRNNAAASQ